MKHCKIFDTISAIILATFVANTNTMLKYYLSTIIFSFFILSVQSQIKIPHSKWTALLQEYVDPYGIIDFKGLKADEEKVDEYLEILSANHPGPYWKIDEQKSYWINAYNAFTVKLILMNYPVKSIMDIKEDDKDAWHIPFIRIGDKLYTLDYIEKTMLLGQFNDSRLHFVINCSAKSCPILRNKAYSTSNIDIELRLATKRFITDRRFNILDENHLQVSQLFFWYKEDFLRDEESIQIYINKNTPHLEVHNNATLNFLNYNWNLNAKK